TLGVLLEKFLGAVEIHARFRQPGVVVHDAVEQRAKIGHHGRELQADHATAENLDVVADPDLVHGPQQPARIGRIGCDIHYARLSAGPHGALLNHISWPTLLFTWNEKFPINSRPRCLTNGMSGAVGTVA